jgi:low affinity Fe/Cu permease
MSKFNEAFAKFATTVARWTGRPPVFATCCFLVVAWALSGPIFKFSDTWQLVINTSTTIITFLMVFLIQNTQNRDNEAIHAKLDALIETSNASNAFIGIENLPDEKLEKILAEYDKVATKLRDDAWAGRPKPKVADTGPMTAKPKSRARTGRAARPKRAPA